MALTRSPTQLPQQTHEEAIGQSEEAKGAQADSDGVATSEGTNSFDREDRPTSGSVDRSAKFDNNQQCHKNRKPAKTVSFALPIAQIREISPPPARRSARLEERALSSIKAASSTNTKSTVKPSTRRSKARDRHGILRSRGSTVFRDGNANANGTMQVSGLGMGCGCGPVVKCQNQTEPPATVIRPGVQISKAEQLEEDEDARLG